MPVVVFASNLTLSHLAGSIAKIQTDPVPLNGYDRASSIGIVHSMVSASGAGGFLDCYAQVSNRRGGPFVNAGVDNHFVGPGVDSVVGNVAGAFLRFEFQFAAGGVPGDFGACCFDLHVNLDKS